MYFEVLINKETAMELIMARSTLGLIKDERDTVKLDYSVCTQSDDREHARELGALKRRYEEQIAKLNEDLELKTTEVEVRAESVSLALLTFKRWWTPMKCWAAYRYNVYKMVA